MVNMYQDILTELSKETGMKLIILHMHNELHFIDVIWKQ